MTKMGKMLYSNQGNFKSQLLIVLEYMLWIKTFLVLHASRLLINMVTTPLAKKGEIIIRHNGMRDLIGDIANDGMLSPVLEKKGILGNTTGRRPEDITIERWAEGKGLAIDVAVMSVLAPTYARLKEPCEWYAATQIDLRPNA